MSFQAVTWAIEQKTGSPSAKSALWSIANYANDVWCAWPKQSTIADDSEQSTDSVGKRVADLIGVGYLRRIKLKRYGRRTHDFLILRPSPLFLAPLADILPHLPAGCDLMDDAAADSDSVDHQESAPVQNDSEISAAADSGSVSSATLPQSAVDATALERQQEPVIKPDTLPQTPSQAGTEAKGQPKEEAAATSAFEVWFKKLNEVYPRPDTRPDQTRDEAMRLSALEREQCLHAATGVAEFSHKNPKARDIVGLLKFIRSSAVWAQYRRFAPTPNAVPPPRVWCEFGSDEWRARAVLCALTDRTMPTATFDEKLQSKGADFLGHLPAAGLVLARFANVAGEINKLDWKLLFTPDRSIGVPIHPNVEGDRGKIAAWRARIQECLGSEAALKIDQHKIEPGLTYLCGGAETVKKWVPGALVPDYWPPNKTGGSTQPLATDEDLKQFGKQGDMMLDVATANLGWHIALTEPSREITAAARLVSLRFQCYLPTFLKSVWAGRSHRRLVTRPLFPGYLFIGMVHGDEQWERVRNAVGVRDFLKVAGRPVTVPFAAIEAIRIKEGELLLPPKQRSTYRKGQEVRIMEGPFSAFLGPIERLNGKGRVDVMVNLFGRPTSINVHETQIEALS